MNSEDVKNNKKTVVLDLDETLIHSVKLEGGMPGHF